VSQLLAFEIDNRQFGLPLEMVLRIVQAVEVTQVPDIPETILGLINIHGSITPVLNTRRKFGLPERPLTLTDHFVIATAADQALALPVDSVQGLVEYSNDQLVPLQEELSHGQSPLSILRTADGMVLVYDPRLALSEDEKSSLATAIQQAYALYDQGN